LKYASIPACFCLVGKKICYRRLQRTVARQNFLQGKEKVPLHTGRMESGSLTQHLHKIFRARHMGFDSPLLKAMLSDFGVGGAALS